MGLPQHRLYVSTHGTQLTVYLKSYEIVRRRNLVLDNELGYIILANIGRSTSRTSYCTGLGQPDGLLAAQTSGPPLRERN